MVYSGLVEEQALIATRFRCPWAPTSHNLQLYSCVVAKGLPNRRSAPQVHSKSGGRRRGRDLYRASGTRLTRPAGGRRWWAHLAFTRINIEPTIL